MIFFIAALFLLTSCGAFFSKHDEFNKDYISKDGTVAIKGIFVFLIFLGHAMTYIDATGTFDLPYVKIQRYLDQMVVSMFFFYSGFGIMEQIKRRGGAYIGTIPKKRFPQLLLNMDICVVLFIILNAAIGQTFGAKQILLSLIGWESVGNTNWYIFVMLALYIVTYLSFLIIKKKNNKPTQFLGLCLATALSVLLIFAIAKGKAGHAFWYDTLILYAFGMWYSFFKNIIEKVLMKNDLIYFAVFAIVALGYLEAYNIRMRTNFRLYIYTPWAMLFTLGIVMMTLKVKIGNPVLEWFGNHVFSVYMLQRLPMILLTHLGVAERHKYAFLLASLVITVLLAEIFDRCTGTIYSKIWKTKKPEIKRQTADTSA